MKDWTQEIGAETSDAWQATRKFQQALHKLFLDLVPAGKELVEQCSLNVSSSLIEINCPSAEVVIAMSEYVESLSVGIWQMARYLRLSSVPKACISVGGLQIFPAWNPCRFLKSVFGIQSSAAFPENRDIDFEAAHYDDCAIYITQMHDQTIVYANPAALRANSKAPEEMIGKDCIALWDDEHLLYLCETLPNAGHMTEHCYPGLRWVKDEKNRSWRRDRYIFVSDYEYLPDHNGVPSRFCRIKQAVKVASGSAISVR